MSTIGRDNERNRTAWLTKTLAAIPAGARILDAGAGELRYKPLCEHLNYVSQDFGEFDGKSDAAGMQFSEWDATNVDIRCDIASIPEPDDSFDAIMCVEVFEHLPDPIVAIAEFSRLLRKGGKLVLTAPFCSLTHQAPYFFSTGFSRYYYEKHLADHGFDIIEIKNNGSYFEYLAQELHRVSSMAKRYCDDYPHRWERWLMRALLRMLGRFAARDSTSHELLCYGLQVVAERSE